MEAQKQINRTVAEILEMHEQEIEALKAEIEGLKEGDE